ncbi:hypothetical protein CGZ54_28425, partial [Enterobacter hormaechei]
MRGGQQTISLAGLKAALLFIDAQQKRVGSERAWIKKGDSPPLRVPPATTLQPATATLSSSSPASEVYKRQAMHRSR